MLLAPERGKLGLLMKVYELEEARYRIMLVLQKRYKRVAHTGQRNGKRIEEVYIVKCGNVVIIVELVIDAFVW